MRGGNVTVRLTSRWPYNPISLGVGRVPGRASSATRITHDRQPRYEASMTHGCRAGTVDELMEGMAIYRDMPVWVPDLDAAIAVRRSTMRPGQALRLRRRRGNSADLLGTTGRATATLVVLRRWRSQSSWPAGRGYSIRT
jgi:hypothetical protein